MQTLHAASSPKQMAIDAASQNGKMIGVEEQQRIDIVLVETNSNPVIEGSLDICESYAGVASKPISMNDLQILNSGGRIIVEDEIAVRKRFFLLIIIQLSYYFLLILSHDFQGYTNGGLM